MLSYFGLTLDLTCYACPEQYDVYYEGTFCGRMRLRNGLFRVDYYDSEGFRETVYESETEGDGIFNNEEEREYHLKKGAKKIYKRLIV